MRGGTANASLETDDSRVGGADWHYRAGRVMVTGKGSGVDCGHSCFTGESLPQSTPDPVRCDLPSQSGRWGDLDITRQRGEPFLNAGDDICVGGYLAGDGE